MNMSNKELIKLYREVVPESNYEECHGCHQGTIRCIGVHTLYSICPCVGCLVKTSCTEYCEEFLLRLRMSLARNRRMTWVKGTHKGYIIMIKYKRQKFKISHTLKRWME